MQKSTLLTLGMVHNQIHKQTFIVSRIWNPNPVFMILWHDHDPLSLL